MAIKILVMGLPGAGKTYFSEQLKAYLEKHGDKLKVNPASINLEVIPDDTFFNVTVDWFNADEIRKRFNDWDFSREGRIRQSLRMFEFALKCHGDYAICDFVAPLPEMRENFKADWTIWIDTIDSGRFEDTNRAFVPPEKYDFRITEQNAEKWAAYVGQKILEGKK